MILLWTYKTLRFPQGATYQNKLWHVHGKNMQPLKTDELLAFINRRGEPRYIHLVFDTDVKPFRREYLDQAGIEW